MHWLISFTTMIELLLLNFEVLEPSHNKETLVNMKMRWELNLCNYFWLLTVYSFCSTGGGSVVFDSLFSLLHFCGVLCLVLV